MNLFVLDEDPAIAAKQLCNKHIVKMPTETANMLLWPFKKLGLELPKTKSGNTIKLSHENHPATQWIMQSLTNYRWGLIHLKTMCEEYSVRYKNKHFAENYFNYCFGYLNELINSNFFEVRGLSDFVRCFSSYADKITEPDTVKAYRQFYILDKPFAQWSSIEAIPDWWPDKNAVDKNFVNGEYIKR